MILAVSSRDVGPYRFTVRSYPNGRSVVLCGHPGASYNGVHTAVKLHGLSHQEVLRRMPEISRVYITRDVPEWPEWRRDRPQTWGRSQTTRYRDWQVYVEITTRHRYGYAVWLIDFAAPFAQSRRIESPRYASYGELQEALAVVEESVPALIVEQIL